MPLSREALAVLAGESNCHVEQADCLRFMEDLPDDCCDLVFGSPPYEDRRAYGEVKFRLKGQQWVDWMVAVFERALRVSRGLVAFVVGHGVTDDYLWSATPALLMADLHRKGVVLRTPPIFERNGIFGSGGKDWWRNDYEFVVCATRSRAKLPWSNNRACGKPPRWAAGGEASHRLPDGARRNQWGGSKKGGGTRRANGKVQTKERPSHEYGNARDRRSRESHGAYVPPAIANPGNVLQERYSAEEVAEIVAELHDAEQGDVSHCKVGGGNMGSQLAHNNEAPFPLELAERFVLTFCPPGGLVYDPFSGSGTTCHAAVENRRRALATDLRAGQVELSRRRVSGVTPKLVVLADQLLEAAPRPKGERLPQAEGQGTGLFDGLDGGAEGP